MIYDFATYAERAALEQGRPYQDMPYIHALCDAIQLTVSGNLPEGKKNLLVTIPPRHYKTSYISQAFPAWCLGEVAPDCEFILTSATDRLAKANSIEIRRQISAPWYRELYPHVRISTADKDEQGFFRTTCGGSIYATGLGGTITGFGAGKVRDGFGGAIIIDDPLKAGDAKSAARRDMAIDYYTKVLKSRRNIASRTPIILVMQRLHMDDLAGWILRNEASSWHHVSFPAVQDGHVLNSVTTTLEELEALRLVDPETFYAQYQQTPIVAGGSIIKLDWWKTFDPDAGRHGGLIFLTADTAFKAEKKNDASVIRVWEGTQDALYCLDAIYGRWEFPELLSRAKKFWDVWAERGAREFWIEDKASGTPLEQMLQSAGVPAQAWAPRDFDFPDDKVARTKAASWAVYGGHVYVPKGDVPIVMPSGEVWHVAEHSRVLMEEAAAFCTDMSHAHDDHVDCLSEAVSLWKQAGGGK